MNSGMLRLLFLEQKENNASVTTTYFQHFSALIINVLP
jgi:hypothetical protein